MGDMGDLFRDWNEIKKERKDRNLESAFSFGTSGWTVHTPIHWSRIVDGDRLEYWPSTRKFRFRGKTRVGGQTDIEEFIRKLPEQALSRRERARLRREQEAADAANPQ